MSWISTALSAGLHVIVLTKPIVDAVVHFIHIVHVELPFLIFKNLHVRLVHNGSRFFHQRLFSVLLQQAVESLLLANSKLTRLDARMVDTKERIYIIH